MWSCVEIGSNRILNTRAILRVDDVDQVYVERGDDLQLLLTMDVFSPTGEHVAKIRRNAWVFNRDDGLELTTKPSDLRLTEKATGTVVVSVEVVDRDVIRIPQAMLYTASGLLIRVTSTAMIMPGNNTLSRSTFDRSGGAAIALATR